MGKIDILLDDGGHKNIQQITSFMESVKFIKPGGKIVVEDTHTSYMKKKGFKTPSKYSFINFCAPLDIIQIYILIKMFAKTFYLQLEVEAHLLFFILCVLMNY